MTVVHDDGTICMAEFWEQSAKFLTARAEKAEELSRDYETIIENMWSSLTPQEPSPKFKAKVEALIEGMKNRPSRTSAQAKDADRG